MSVFKRLNPLTKRITDSYKRVKHFYDEETAYESSVPADVKSLPKVDEPLEQLQFTGNTWNLNEEPNPLLTGDTAVGAGQIHNQYSEHTVAVEHEAPNPELDKAAEEFFKEEVFKEDSFKLKQESKDAHMGILHYSLRRAIYGVRRQFADKTPATSNKTQDARLSRRNLRRNS